MYILLSLYYVDAWVNNSSDQENFVSGDDKKLEETKNEVSRTHLILSGIIFFVQTLELIHSFFISNSKTIGYNNGKKCVMLTHSCINYICMLILFPYQIFNGIVCEEVLAFGSIVTDDGDNKYSGLAGIGLGNSLLHYCLGIFFVLLGIYYATNCSYYGGMNRLKWFNQTCYFEMILTFIMPILGDIIGHNGDLVALYNYLFVRSVYKNNQVKTILVHRGYQIMFFFVE